MGDSVDEITVIVRSVGERTTDACQRLLEQQVPEGNVVRVEDLAYENYVTGAYELGIDHGRMWTLVVDADVLPGRHMAERILQLGRTAGSDLFAAEGWVRDKFFAGPIMGGGTLYRTELLPDAMEVVPRSDGVARPETETIQRMGERGYSVRWSDDLLVGVHDYEQSYRDIYRKANRYSRKDEYYIPVMEPYWQRDEADDPDLRVFHRAIRLANQVEEELTFDAKQFADADIEAVLDRLGLEEKPPLPASEISFSDIDEWMASPTPPEYRRYQRLGRVRESPLWQRLPRPARYLTILLLQQPFPETIPWTIGSAMARLGEELRRFGEP